MEDRSAAFQGISGRKYNVTKAYYFIGYMPENQDLYQSLQEYGYVLIFKPTLKIPGGKVKGNCDAELVSQAMIELSKYDKALIVTSDGDFSCLVKYLNKINKLKTVLSPTRQHCSTLLQKAAKDKINFLNDLQRKLQR